MPPTPITNVVQELEQIKEEFSMIEKDIEFEGARVIGDGAGGQVYMARLRASRQVVAVKVMNVGERDPDRLSKRMILDMLQVNTLSCVCISFSLSLVLSPARVLQVPNLISCALPGN